MKYVKVLEEKTMPEGYSEFEKASFPVMICDETNMVVYKNKRAVKLVPSIRKGSRINRFILPHLSNKSKYRKIPKLTNLLTNDYYRAAVSYTVDGGTLLIFPRFIQFFYTCDFVPEQKYVYYADACLEALQKKNSESCSSEFLYDRIRKSAGELYGEFCKSGASGTKTDVRFAIASIVAAGQDILKKHGRRLEHDMGNLARDSGKLISHGSLSYVLSELLILTFRSSKSRAVSVSFNDKGRVIEAVISCAKDFDIDGAVAADADMLYSVCPDDPESVAVIEAIVSDEKWKLEPYFGDDGKLLCIRLTLCDKSTDAGRLFSSGSARTFVAEQTINSIVRKTIETKLIG